MRKTVFLCVIALLIILTAGCAGSAPGSGGSDDPREGVVKEEGAARLAQEPEAAASTEAITQDQDSGMNAGVKDLTSGTNAGEEDQESRRNAGEDSLDAGTEAGENGLDSGTEAREDRLAAGTDAQGGSAPKAGGLEDADPGNQEISFTMYFVDPDTSPYVEGGKKIAELVRKATDGKIRIDVVGGSETGERELVEKAMDNELDIVTCANSVLTNYIPQMNILDQAYLWENADEAHAAVDGMLGDLIRRKAETLGLHVIGFEESGFRNTFSTIPIESVKDFDDIVIRTMENKYHQAAFSAFGAEPIGMPYPEVLDALKDGRINACENATVNCLNSGYYQYTKHVTLTQHAFVYILLIMSDEAWDRIPEDLVIPFMDAVKQGVAWERKRLVEANEIIEKELEDLGVTFHQIDVAQLKSLYQEAAEEKGFTFDPEWAVAVNEAIREAA